MRRFARHSRALLAVLLPAVAGAAEIRHLEVTYDDGVYSVDSEVWFAAEPEAVFRVMSNWNLSVAFSSAIVEARNIGPDENGRRGFYVRNQACFLFFCKTAERRGTVESEKNRWLSASADPESSDFRRSDEYWTFRAADGGTVVRYTLQMQPAFWVPPVIGPYIVRRKLHDEGVEALNRIERIALQSLPDDG